MSRLQDNLNIVNVLTTYLTDNPDIRLGQALVNLEIVQIEIQYVEQPENLPPERVAKVLDPFYEEPSETYNRVKIALLQAYSRSDGNSEKGTPSSEA